MILFCATLNRLKLVLRMATKNAEVDSKNIKKVVIILGFGTF